MPAIRERILFTKEWSVSDEDNDEKPLRPTYKFETVNGRKSFVKKRKFYGRIQRAITKKQFPNLEITQKSSRFLNMIVLQALLSNGDISGEQLIKELFAPGGIITNTSPTITKTITDDYLKKLKELKNNQTLSVPAKDLGEAVNMLNLCVREYEEVGDLKDKTAGAAYFKMLEQLKGKGINEKHFDSVSDNLNLHITGMDNLEGSANPSNQLSKLNLLINIDQFPKDFRSTLTTFKTLLSALNLLTSPDYVNAPHSKLVALHAVLVRLKGSFNSAALERLELVKKASEAHAVFTKPPTEAINYLVQIVTVEIRRLSMKLNITSGFTNGYADIGNVEQDFAGSDMESVFPGLDQKAVVEALLSVCSLFDPLLKDVARRLQTAKSGHTVRNFNLLTGQFANFSDVPTETTVKTVTDFAAKPVPNVKFFEDYLASMEKSVELRSILLYLEQKVRYFEALLDKISPLIAKLKNHVPTSTITDVNTVPEHMKKFLEFKEAQELLNYLKATKEAVEDTKTKLTAFNIKDTIEELHGKKKVYGDFLAHANLNSVIDYLDDMKKIKKEINSASDAVKMVKIVEGVDMQDIEQLSTMFNDLWNAVPMFTSLSQAADALNGTKQIDLLDRLHKLGLNNLMKTFGGASMGLENFYQVLAQEDKLKGFFLIADTVLNNIDAKVPEPMKSKLRKAWNNEYEALKSAFRKRIAKVKELVILIDPTQISNLAGLNGTFSPFIGFKDVNLVMDDCRNVLKELSERDPSFRGLRDELENFASMNMNLTSSSASLSQAVGILDEIDLVFARATAPQNAPPPVQTSRPNFSSSTAKPQEPQLELETTTEPGVGILLPIAIVSIICILVSALGTIFGYRKWKKDPAHSATPAGSTEDLHPFAPPTTSTDTPTQEAPNPDGVAPAAPPAPPPAAPPVAPPTAPPAPPAAPPAPPGAPPVAPANLEPHEVQQDDSRVPGFDAYNNPVGHGIHSKYDRIELFEQWKSDTEEVQKVISDPLNIAKNETIDDSKCVEEQVLTQRLKEDRKEEYVCCEAVKTTDGVEIDANRITLGLSTHIVGSAITEASKADYTQSIWESGACHVGQCCTAEESFQIFPNKMGEVVDVVRYKVELLEAPKFLNNGELVRRQLKVTHIKTRQWKRLTHYHFAKWTKDRKVHPGEKDLCAAMTTFINETEHRKNPVFIYSKKGTGRAAVLSGSQMRYERSYMMRKKSHVMAVASMDDVLFSLRRCRRGMVETFDQYLAIVLLPIHWFVDSDVLNTNQKAELLKIVNPMWEIVRGGRKPLSAEDCKKAQVNCEKIMAIQQKKTAKYEKDVKDRHAIRGSTESGSCRDPGPVDDEFDENTRFEGTFHDWTYIKKLGAGASGQVLLGRNENGHLATIKIENDAEMSWNMEKKTANRLLNNPNAMHFFDDGVFKGRHFHVATLCGMDLENLINKYKEEHKKLDPVTVLRLSISTFLPVKEMQDAGFIHRDIKPANFAVDINPESNIIRLLDYGMCRQIMKPTKFGFITRLMRYFPKILGNMMYGASNMFRDQDLGRTDDLESWLAMCAGWVSLPPWANVTKADVVKKWKPEMIADYFLHGDPIIRDLFGDIFLHIQRGGYYDRPNYSLILEMLLTKLHAYGGTLTGPMCYDKYRNQDYPYKHKETYESLRYPENSNKNHDFSTLIKECRYRVDHSYTGTHLGGGTKFALKREMAWDELDDDMPAEKLIDVEKVPTETRHYRKHPDAIMDDRYPEQAPQKSEKSERKDGKTRAELEKEAMEKERNKHDDTIRENEKIEPVLLPEKPEKKKSGKTTKKIAATPSSKAKTTKAKTTKKEPPTPSKTMTKPKK